jgi:hypothetical protein
MAVHMISYDLIKRKDYPELWKAIALYSVRTNVLKSQWIVVTAHSAEQVFDTLRPHIDNDDKLLVTELKGLWKCTNSLGKPVTDWLQANLHP